MVLSGDLTSYASEDELNAAKDLLRELAELLKQKVQPWRMGLQENAPRLVVVLGNHDLDWSKPTYKQRIERYARLAQDLAPLGVMSAVQQTSDQCTFWDYGDDANVFVKLVNTTTLGGIEDEQLVRLRNILKRDYERLLQENDRAFDEALSALEVHIRQDPGYGDIAAIDRIPLELHGVPGHRVKIAVMHHNPSSVLTFGPRFPPACTIQLGR